MTTAEATIPFPVLKSLLALAAAKGVRTCLEGVWLDFQGPTVIAWACNGVRLGAYRTEEPSTDMPALFIPRDVIEAGAKAFGRYPVTISIIGERSRAIRGGAGGGAQYTWRDDDWKPLDWRRVVPAKSDGRTAQFNVDEIAAFAKARAALPVKKSGIGGVLLHHNGDSGALVTLIGVPEFVGVLAPLRQNATGELRSTPPLWVSEKTATEGALA